MLLGSKHLATGLLSCVFAFLTRIQLHLMLYFVLIPLIIIIRQTYKVCNQQTYKTKANKQTGKKITNPTKRTTMALSLLLWSLTCHTVVFLLTDCHYVVFTPISCFDVMPSNCLPLSRLLGLLITVSL